MIFMGPSQFETFYDVSSHAYMHTHTHTHNKTHTCIQRVCTHAHQQHVLPLLLTLQPLLRAYCHSPLPFLQMAKRGTEKAEDIS